MFHKGLVTLVTGGASGLGRGTAERFVGQGSKVVICDLPSSQGQEVAGRLGDDAVFVPTDVCSVWQLDLLYILHFAIFQIRVSDEKCLLYKLVLSWR